LASVGYARGEVKAINDITEQIHKLRDLRGGFAGDAYKVIATEIKRLEELRKQKVASLLTDFEVYKSKKVLEQLGVKKFD